MLRQPCVRLHGHGVEGARKGERMKSPRGGMSHAALLKFKRL